MPQFVDGNEAHIYVNGKECLDVLIERLEQARHHIHIEMMLFYNDQAGIEIANVLKEKARIEGLQVRILVNFPATDWSIPTLKRPDDTPTIKNNPTSSLPLFDEMREVGIQIINSHPVSHFGTDVETIENRNIDALATMLGIGPAILVQIKNAILRGYYRRESYDPESIPEVFHERQQVLDSKMSTSWATLPPFFNLDHRKIIIIDGKEAFICCLNFGTEYLHDLPFDDNLDERYWHDAQAWIQGPVVNQVQRLFAERWMVSGGDVFSQWANFEVGPDFPGDLYFPDVPSVGQMRAAVLASGYESKEENPIRNEIQNKIAGSWGQPIYVLNPYLCDDGLINYLITASNHGSEINVICADHRNDSPPTRDAGQYRYKPMVEAGISVYEYPGRFSHLKLMTIGSDWTTIGSYNWNYRSALRDLECNLFVLSTDLVDEAKTKIIEPDIAAAIEAHQNISDPPPPPEEYPLGLLNSTSYNLLPANVKENLETRTMLTEAAEDWEVN